MNNETRTNCCDAPFLGVGWPECDICSDCKEHAEPVEDDDTEDDTKSQTKGKEQGE